MLTTARAATILFFMLGAGCRSGCDKASAPAPAPTTSPTGAVPLAAPITLLQLDKSAFHTKLELGPDAIYLLTMEGAFRLNPGQPPQESKLDLSDTAVATPTSFVFWSNGALWLAPKHGGPPGRLASVPARPIAIVSVEERFAWIGPDAQGHHTVFALRQGEPYAIHTVEGMVASATMVDDRVVFLERVGNDGWRLGSVARTGGQVDFTPTRKGRYPAMLVPAGDVYYYFWDDKDVSEVWAVSPDLRHERVVANHVTCSPIAVADAVFCVNMEGVFEISPSSGLPRLVSPYDPASITTLAVDRQRIVWVRDAGPDKLEVKLLYRNGKP